jgi:hypothetical protein
VRSNRAGEVENRRPNRPPVRSIEDWERKRTTPPREVVRSCFRPEPAAGYRLMIKPKSTPLMNKPSRF